MADVTDGFAITHARHQRHSVCIACGNHFQLHRTPPEAVDALFRNQAVEVARLRSVVVAINVRASDHVGAFCIVVTDIEHGLAADGIGFLRGCGADGRGPGSKSRGSSRWT